MINTLLHQTSQFIKIILILIQFNLVIITTLVIIIILLKIKNSKKNNRINYINK